MIKRMLAVGIVLALSAGSVFAEIDQARYQKGLAALAAGEPGQWGNLIQAQTKTIDHMEQIRDDLAAIKGDNFQALIIYANVSAILIDRGRLDADTIAEEIQAIADKNDLSTPHSAMQKLAGKSENVALKTRILAEGIEAGHVHSRWGMRLAREVEDKQLALQAAKTVCKKYSAKPGKASSAVKLIYNEALDGNISVYEAARAVFRVKSNSEAKLNQMDDDENKDKFREDLQYITSYLDKLGVETVADLNELKNQ